MQETSVVPSTYYRVSLKAIIRNDKHEVLVNKEQGRYHWGLPGGGWEHGETDIECLKRELFEEVGYAGDLTVHSVATTREPMFMQTKKAWLLCMVYEVTTENADFRVGEESDEIMFANPKQFKDSKSRSERLIYDFCAT